MHQPFSAVLLSLTFLATLTASSSAQAYCVYNKGDYKLYARQLDLKNGIPQGMSKTIKPDKRECCNWQESDCNPKGKKTSPVYFEVRFTRDISPGLAASRYCGPVREVPMSGGSPNMRAIKTQAGGYIVVRNNNGSFDGRYTSYTHDDKVIEEGTCTADNNP
jgi:hypothetical protein